MLRLSTVYDCWSKDIRHHTNQLLKSNVPSLELDQFISVLRSFRYDAWLCTLSSDHRTSIRFWHQRLSPIGSRTSPKFSSSGYSTPWSRGHVILNSEIRRCSHLSETVQIPSGLLRCKCLGLSIHPQGPPFLLIEELLRVTHTFGTSRSIYMSSQISDGNGIVVFERTGLIVYDMRRSLYRYQILESWVQSAEYAADVEWARFVLSQSVYGNNKGNNQSLAYAQTIVLSLFFTRRVDRYMARSISSLVSFPVNGVTIIPRKPFYEFREHMKKDWM
jgi:hypothetical protein